MSDVEKLTTYWRIRSGDEPEAKPVWEQIPAPPESREGLKVENDDQVMWLFFEDEAARELVTRGARDAVALVQEWEIPHKPAKRFDS